MERDVLRFKAISLVGRTKNFRGLEAILPAPVKLILAEVTSV